SRAAPISSSSLTRGGAISGGSIPPPLAVAPTLALRAASGMSTRSAKKLSSAPCTREEFAAMSLARAVSGPGASSLRCAATLDVARDAREVAEHLGHLRKAQLRAADVAPLAQRHLDEV